jgi:hypothetical protein
MSTVTQTPKAGKTFYSMFKFFCLDRFCKT